MTAPGPRLANLVRGELRKGSYQMPGDTLPYETQANNIVAQLTAAGFGLVADAEAEAWQMGYSKGYQKAWQEAKELQKATP